MREQRQDGIVFSHPQLNEYEYRQLYLSVDESVNIFQKKKSEITFDYSGKHYALMTYLFGVRYCVSKCNRLQTL